MKIEGDTAHKMEHVVILGQPEWQWTERILGFSH